MYIYSLQQVDFENKNPYGLTWENSMAPKHDLYSDSMPSSSWVQFNIMLGILKADLEKKLVIEFLINSVEVKFP